MLESSKAISRFERVLHWRRRQSRARYACLLLAFAYVLTCTPIWLAVSWLVACVAGQILELIGWRVLAARGQEHGPRARRFGDVSLAFNSALFGSMPWLVLAGGERWVFAGATLGFAASLVFSVTSTRGSTRACSAVIAPYLVYAAGLPVFAAAFGMPVLGVVNLAIACIIILVVSLLVWRLSGEMLDTEENALEEATERRNEADAANAAKSAFVSTVSHELRTPMSAILAGAAALQERCEGSARNHAALIVDAGAMMQRLLDDLLDHAKIEAGKLDIEVLPMDARALVAGAVAFWRPTARRKGLRLRVEGGRNLPRWVLGDPTRLRQILNNLLSNALKFTDRGVVTLRMKIDGAGVVFEVQDTGPGLTAEQSARLFQPFEQGAADRARTHGGTGLGLSISRNLARLMGGDLTVESRAGHGATFRLTTVLAACAAPPIEEVKASDPGAQAALRTLVVDDHDINQRAFQAILEAIGAQVCVASSGEAALTLLAVEDFDVVLMDVNMAGMSGIETTRRIRAGDARNREVPVIAVTGSVETGDIALYLAAGMDRVVPKPVTPATLLSAIGEVLNPEPGSDHAPPSPRSAPG